MSIQAQLLQQLRSLDRVERYVVAFSGGLDSTVLLSLLSACRNGAKADVRSELKPFPKVCALHVNHGVSPNAQMWEQHCQTVCEELQISCNFAGASLPNSGRVSESSMREARYNEFQAFLLEGDVLLQGHHADDQTETILLRLLRGTGTLGAKGIGRERRLGNGRLYRPLLSLRREDLQGYAQEQGLTWIEDESNEDPQYDRNYLRAKVLPNLTERWPDYQSGFARFGEINGWVDSTLAYFLGNELPQLTTSHGQLNLRKLVNYPMPVQLNLMRAWLTEYGVKLPNMQQSKVILSDVVNAGSDADPIYDVGEYQVRRFKGSLYCVTAESQIQPRIKRAWDLQSPLYLDARHSLVSVAGLPGGLDPEIRERSVEIRFRMGGERCQPKGRVGSHPLKKLFQEWGVPPWERANTPLVFVGDQLAAVVGYCVCEDFSVTENQLGIEIKLEKLFG